MIENSITSCSFVWKIFFLDKEIIHIYLLNYLLLVIHSNPVMRPIFYDCLSIALKYLMCEGEELCLFCWGKKNQLQNISTANSIQPSKLPKSIKYLVASHFSLVSFLQQKSEAFYCTLPNYRCNVLSQRNEKVAFEPLVLVGISYFSHWNL